MAHGLGIAYGVRRTRNLSPRLRETNSSCAAGRRPFPPRASRAADLAPHTYHGHHAQRQRRTAKQATSTRPAAWRPFPPRTTQTDIAGSLAFRGAEWGRMGAGALLPTPRALARGVVCAFRCARRLRMVTGRPRGYPGPGSVHCALRLLLCLQLAKRLLHRRNVRVLGWC